MDDITPLLPGDAVAFLRIADESRRFPFRPMSNGLFLIGRGAGCDLRLGGDDLPELICVLQVSGRHAEIFCVSSHPPVLVNGDVVKSCQLEDGDLIEVGDVRSVFRFCEPHASGSEPALQVVPDTPLDLVSGVESELALVEALQDNSEHRLQALLTAAHEAVESLGVARTIRFSDYSPNPAESAEHTNQFGPAILERLQVQESRLDDVLQVLEQVVRQQQLITAALQCLADRVTGAAADPAAAGSLKASA